MLMHIFCSCVSKHPFSDNIYSYFVLNPHYQNIPDCILFAYFDFSLMLYKIKIKLF